MFFFCALIFAWNCCVIDVEGSHGSVPKPTFFYIATTGNDDNTGRTPSEPLSSCAGAVRAIQQLSTELGTAHGVPDGGIDVQFAPGVYTLNEATTCGSVTLDGQEHAPVVFRGVGGTVVFDASNR